MVPADSRRVSPAPRYSGFHYLVNTLRLQGCHLLWRAFPGPSTHMLTQISWPYNPDASVNAPVWAGPRSLATTCGITFVFSSWAYLDVSVRPVRHLACARFKGLPHSEIRGSAPLCGSPRLIAALHVLRRLSMPRHPPCALRNLVFFTVLAPRTAHGPKKPHLTLGTRLLITTFCLQTPPPSGALRPPESVPAY